VAGKPVTNTAVVALDTGLVVAHRRRTAEISSLTEEQRQKMTKTVLEVAHGEVREPHRHHHQNSYLGITKRVATEYVQKIRA
jgi:hypothetical protein